jgi:hypothetical protein
MILGLIVGILLPPLSLFLVLSFKPELLAVGRIDTTSMMNLILQIVSIGLLGNGLAFFAGLRLNKDYFSKGILSSSLIFLVIIVAFKFLYKP